MAWLKIASILHVLADVTQAAHDQIPQDTQQKANVSVALQAVHDGADAIAQVADANGGSLSGETAKETIVQLAAPIIEELVTKAVSEALAKAFGIHTGTSVAQTTTQSQG